MGVLKLDNKCGSPMPKTTDESSVYTKLRDKAEAQLQTGTTPAAGQWSMGVDALRLLHGLSSDPDKADDALKLLHELQVHQVELDLQNEEIADNERALVEDLRLFRALYDSAPLAYCVVDLKGIVTQSNRAAVELFGADNEYLEGQRIDSFVGPENRSQLLGLLESVAKTGARDSCAVETDGGENGARHLQFFASIAPGHAHILLACCPCATVE